MSSDYTTVPASDVKAGDIIYWASVRSHVEVLGVGHGFYGYTFDVRYLGKVEQARYRDNDVVQVKRTEKKGEKNWWEESPEEFANGFTEETQVHHNEGPAINQNSNEAMAALYGPPAAYSEYSRFTRVRYREGSKEKQGLIIWITEATKDSPMLYVVEQEGFPDWVAGSDILGAAE